jgi:hypothetical protein
MEQIPRSGPRVSEDSAFWSTQIPRDGRKIVALRGWKIFILDCGSGVSNGWDAPIPRGRPALSVRKAGAAAAQ